MSKYLSIEQVVDAARNDVARKVKQGMFTGRRDTTNDDQENVHTIVSLYSQWAEDQGKAEDAIMEMMETEFKRYL